MYNKEILALEDVKRIAMAAETEGGIPLKYKDEIVGAIGVSGVKSSEDGQIAQAGADAL